MLPKTQAENTIFWVVSFVSSLLIAFLSSYLKQATTIPDDAPITLRPIIVDLASHLVASIPILVAGLLTPKYGRETISAIVSDLGKEEAIARLETPVENSEITYNDIDMDALAKAILKENARRQSNAETK